LLSQISAPSSKNLKTTSYIILTVVRIPESISPNAQNISMELATERWKLAHYSGSVQSRVITVKFSSAWKL